jgi:ferredoxin
LSSGYMPERNAELCTVCGTCIERCPADALTSGAGGIPELNMDRCIGCAVCATGCPSEAVVMIERPGIPVPPVDQKALKEAIKASRG